MKCSSPLSARYSKAIREEALMKLSNEDFVRHLAAAMQTDEKETEENLSQWVRYIGSELDQHGSCTLEGVGVLTREAETIVFVPDERLAVEINYKYAGMQPLQLAPGRPGEAPAPDLTPPQSNDKTSADREIPITDTEGVEEKSEEREISVADTGSVEMSGDEPGEPGNREPLNSGVDSSEEPPKIVVAAKPAADSEKPRTSIALKLIPVAAVLIVAFLLYVHFDGQRLDQNNFGSLAEQELTISDVPLPAPGEETNQTTIGPEGEIDAVVPERDPRDSREVPETPVEGAADVYGLHGSEHSALSGAYSIVVYSLSNADRARNERNRLEEQGFRALLWMATTSDGSTTWRVGAGQFRSVADAVEAANRLPEPYKSNHFIIRIQ